MTEVSMDTIVSLCKRRGLIFQSSEIYGGLGSTWDYGPLGVELKNNVKVMWWRTVVYERDDMEGLDAAILMHPRTWEASGHIESFTDPLVDCKACKKRYKADDLSDNTTCPECGGELTSPRQFNLMFKTHVGPVEDRMEIEYFVKPGTDKEWFDFWVQERFNWYVKFGIRKDNLRLRPHEGNELAHYAISCVDVEYRFPMGWSELEGIANRTDYDLKQHIKFSGKDLSVFDEKEQTRYLPYVIEPSAGVDRSALAFLVDSYRQETVRGQKRVILALHPLLAPIKAAVLPLLRNRPEIVAMAKKLAAEMRTHFYTTYDETASIGRLYRRQDEIGTPFCITVDVQSLDDHQVTIRERDSMEQIRLPIEKVRTHIEEQLKQAG